jgi:hypothetical protein
MVLHMEFEMECDNHGHYQLLTSMICNGFGHKDS